MLKYLVNSPTGNSWSEPKKVDCVQLVDATVDLGVFKSKSGDQQVTLKFNAQYYPQDEFLFVRWALKLMNDGEHRTRIMPWEGGLSALLALNEYLNEALEWSARCIVDPEFYHSKHSREKTPWVCTEEFAPVMVAVTGSSLMPYEISEVDPQ